MSFQKNKLSLFLPIFVFFMAGCDNFKFWLDYKTNSVKCAIQSLPNLDRVQRSLNIDSNLINLDEVNQAITAFGNDLINTYPQTCSPTALLSALSALERLKHEGGADNAIDAKLAYFKKALKIFETAEKNAQGDEKRNISAIKAQLIDKIEELNSGS